MSRKTVRIGGACGYWGENVMATPQLLASNAVDYIVYDYLAEITMSILARAQAKNPEMGYATDFVSLVLTHNLRQIQDSKVKIVSNAGGLNPEACGEAVRKLIENLGLKLKVAVVTGDNLTSQATQIAAKNPQEMFTGADFPAPEKIASINTYLGAFPIARALDAGADIVITGRSVDSAVTLGICIYEFGWKNNHYNELASGSLAGHILECGPQATGGNFTDWQSVGDIADIGYPIAEIKADGSFEVSKPAGTTGLVSIGTIAEQMLYEIGDPQAYILPDVVCDFSDVTITQIDQNRVHVSSAKGYPPPDTYKTCVTYADGFRTGGTVNFYGFDAEKRGQAYADAAFKRARRTLRLLNAAEFTETSIEIMGAGSQFGNFGKQSNVTEVVVKIAAKHPTPLEGGVLLKEMAGLGLAAPSGLSGFKGGSSKPTPMIRLFSYLTAKEDISITIDIDKKIEIFKDIPGTVFNANALTRPKAPDKPAPHEKMVEVPLVKLAWARSGDKGDKANIGVIAREAKYFPYIWDTLTEISIAERFAHFIDTGADSQKVERFILPGCHAINFLIDAILGGGGIASLRNDPQAKGYSQILLNHPIKIPASFAEELA